MICALPFLLLTPPLPGQTLTAEDIMCRVAENQQRAQDARNSFVYDMNVFVRLKRANGKLAREESRDYIVAPTARGAQRKLAHLEGKIFDGSKEIAYSKAHFEYKKTDIDAGVTDAFARSIMWKKHEAGVWVDWFPLTGAHQSRYEFKIEGEERYHDYDVYKVSFQQLKPDDLEDCWSGEALIERREFQPVLISTRWACKVPRAVTFLLGINVSQIGAKVTYQRFDKDAWFPVTGGGEMKLRIFFLYARTIAFAAKNSGFRKTDVQSSIAFGGEVEDANDVNFPQPSRSVASRTAVRYERIAGLMIDSNMVRM